MENLDYYKEKIIKLFNLYKIKGPIKNIKELNGGFLHKMFYVETTNLKFAVKLLNPEIMEKENLIDDMVLSEQRAALIKKHFQTNYTTSNIIICCAKSFNNNLLLCCDNDYFFIYDYYNATIFDNNMIEKQHSEKIGQSLAMIHTFAFNNIISKDTFIVFDFNEISLKINKNTLSNQFWVEYFFNNKNLIQSINRKIAYLKQNNQENVISHRDLDPKNVLWLENNPIIIDWECVGVSDALTDLIQTGLYWSKDNNTFSKEKFISFIKGYKKYKKFDFNNIESAILKTCYSSIGWLEYNLKNIINENFKINNKQTTENEIIKAIDEILLIYNNRNIIKQLVLME